MHAVRMKGISKQFPGVLANDQITFEVERQTIHCLLGENGSGKSTLMNILFGLYHKDEGDIEIKGQPVQIQNPADAERLGIGMVHQHFMLVPQLTVLENIILGDEPGKIVINRKEAQRKVKEIIDTYHFTLDIRQKVADISVGMKQRVEIVKLLFRGAELIIFDEPTAVLTPQEVKELFSIFKALIAKGCTVIFITHKIKEIFQISDRVTVLRKGRCVGTADTASISAAQLSEMMVGRQIAEISPQGRPVLGEPVLEMEGIRLLPGSPQPISLQVRRGEIVGIAGIDGNGQMELEELITGVRRYEGGTMRLCGQDASRLSVAKRKELGIGYIPSDRMRSGALAGSSVKENFLLGYQDTPRYRKGGFVEYRALEEDSRAYAKQYDVRLVSIEQKFSGLSGGNQQKVVLAREVSKDISLMLAAQPIRGLDIGAIEYVHKTLLELRNQGKGILLISAELGELLSLGDRLLVVYEGYFTGEFIRGEFDENQIGLAMIGHAKGGEGDA